MQNHLKTLVWAIAAIFVISACFLLDRQVDKELERANQRLIDELNSWKLDYAPAQRDTIRDSVKTVTQQVLQMQAKQYQSQAADRELLRDLNLRLSQVMAEQRTSMETADTVKALRANSVYTYSDRWLNFRLNTADSILTYKARDSLQTIVYRQYKHKFLWWRWGTKGYDVKVINFNPHSTILYNSYIQVTQ